MSLINLPTPQRPTIHQKMRGFLQCADRLERKKRRTEMLGASRKAAAVSGNSQAETRLGSQFDEALEEEVTAMEELAALALLLVEDGTFQTLTDNHQAA